MNFGNKLSEFLSSSNMKAAEVCRKTGLSKSYFSKMKNGIMLPQDLGKVRDIANAMNLNHDETTQICEAYKKDKLEEKFINIEKSLKKILNLNEYRDNDAESLEFSDMKLFNGQAIKGKENVYNALHLIIKNSKAFTNSILSDCNAEIFKVINQSLTLKNNLFKFHQLIYLDNNEYERNFKCFSEIMPMILSGKVFTKYLYTNINKMHSFSLFPSILLNEDELLLISSDYSVALYMNSADAVSEYSDYFTEKYKSAAYFCVMFESIGSFIKGCSEIFTESEKNIPIDFYVIKRNPCVMLEGTSSIVQEHICDESIDDNFVENYMDFLLKNTIKNVKRYNILFSSKGMDEYFSKEIYYEYNKYIDCPVSFELRKNAFESFFNNAKRSNSIQVGLLADSFFQEPRHCINIWSDGKLLVILNFEKCYRIIILREKTIVNGIVEYFDELKSLKFILSKRETLNIMNQKLKSILNNGSDKNGGKL